MLRDSVFAVIVIVIAWLFQFGQRMHHLQTALGVTLHDLLTCSMDFRAVLLDVWELRQDNMATPELL